jgi:streptomycin 6-kinase
MFAVPAPVRAKAMAADQQAWLAALPDLVAELARDWTLQVGRGYPDATEAVVLETTRADGVAAVLKLHIPGAQVESEITVLRLADGDGCVRLLEANLERSALLLERLGPSLHDLGLPVEQRHEILCRTAEHVWRSAPDAGLTTGAAKARWLADWIIEAWDATDRPCSVHAVDHALSCASRRLAAHDDERAVLVHGDVHEWNTLAAPGGGFKLVDPDGLLAEPEYDLGVIMREDPAELLVGDPRTRARWLARSTGLDEIAIWERGVVERVSTGLLAERVGLQPVGRHMLQAADRIAALEVVPNRRARQGGSS